MAKQPEKRKRGRPTAGGRAETFFVRLPEEFRAPLEAAAKAADRSLNAEVVNRIRVSIAQDAGGK